MLSEKLAGLGHWFRQRLARRAAAGAFAVTLLLVLALGLASFYFARDLTLRALRLELATEAGLVSQKFELGLTQILQDLANLSGSPLVRGGLRPGQAESETIQAFLDNHRALPMVLVRIGIYAPSGEQLAASRQSPGPVERKFLEQAAASRKPEVRLRPDLGHGVLQFARAVHFDASPQEEVILVFELNLEDMLKAGSQIQGQMIDVALLDANALVIYCNKSPYAGSLSIEARLELPPPLDELGLSLRVARPESAITSQFEDLIYVYLSLSAVIALAAMLLSVLVARKVVAPVGELGRIAGQITQSGRVDVAVPELGEDEVGELSRAFKRMLGRISSAHNELEQRIAQRTAEVERKEEYVRSILDNALDGIITIDSSGKVETFNLAAEHMFGRRAEEIIGLNVSLLMPEPYSTNHDLYIESYLSTRKTKIVGKERETVGVRANGERFPMSLSVSEFWVNNDVKFIGIVRDITERKQIEKLKNEFLALVSHELRTPLTSIQGSLVLVTAGAAGDLPPEAFELLEIAKNSSERLARLVDDILDFQKIESGRMVYNLSAQSLKALLRQAVEANRSFGAQYEVALEFSPPLDEAMVLTEPDRFMQVMANLLSNAVKFSPRGSSVEVSSLAGAEFARVEVRDKGEGIPDDFKPRIFKKFSQADTSSSRRVRGTGLGLSIAKALVEGMGGRIGFESSPGQGTMFYFELKLAKEAKS